MTAGVKSDGKSVDDGGIARHQEKGGRRGSLPPGADSPSSSSDLDAQTAAVAAGNADGLKRDLSNRQLQLIAVGGSIGTALFVSIGSGLQRGGPASLVLSFIMHAAVLALVNNGMAEMGTYMPVSGSFLRMAGKWVDEALGFAVGWNFFLHQAIYAPFEITALNLVLGFWRDDIPIAAVCVVCIVVYALLNIVAVHFYGEAEFWLASGKLLLVFIVLFFTFITMCGGNPQHDAYGFRNWGVGGAAFKEYLETGDAGRFHGFMAALFVAAFTVVGPEYVSMTAGEASRPRVNLKQAYKTLWWRLGIFFILGALAVATVLPANDPALDNAGAGTAEGSPYVIAMERLGVGILPHVVNALLCTSIFSAGNAGMYCAVRCLYGLALDGHAPRIFTRTIGNGIPVYSYVVVVAFSCLSLLQVSSGTAHVMGLLQSFLAGAQLLNFVTMSITYIFFHRACLAQGLDRRTLPYFGYFQPYGAYIGLFWMGTLSVLFGYTNFLPGNFDTLNFCSNYAMLGIYIVTFTSWKILKRSRFVRPKEADLVWDKPIIDAYEEQLFPDPPSRFRDDVRRVWGRVFGKKGTEMETRQQEPA